MTDRPTAPGVLTQAVSAAPRAAALERCAATGITKPECHCPACLAVLAANHQHPSGAAGAP